MKQREFHSLVQRACSREDSAFKELCEHKAKEVIFLCIRYLKNKEDGEDAAQEVFIRMQRSIGSLKSPKAFNAWLNRLVYHTCADYRRGAMNRNTILLDDADMDFVDESLEGLPHMMVEDADMRERVVRVIDDLPGQYRSVILMYYYERLSYKEIAAVLEIKETSVVNNLRMAKKHLKKALDGEMGAEMDNTTKMPMVALGPAIHSILKREADATVTPELIRSTLSDAGVLSGAPLPLGPKYAPAHKNVIRVVAILGTAALLAVGIATLSTALPPVPPPSAGQSAGTPQGQAGHGRAGAGDAGGSAAQVASTYRLVDGYLDIPAEYQGARIALSSLQALLIDPSGEVLATTDIAGDGGFSFHDVPITVSGQYTIRVEDKSGGPPPIPIPDAAIDL